MKKDNIEIGDTITWKGVSRIEKGTVERIEYVNGKVTGFVAKLTSGKFVPVALSSVRSAFFAGTSNRTSDEQ